jgi:hypothetical protein
VACLHVPWEQAHFQLALSLHHDLTTGEVAAARDKLGGIQHGNEPEKGEVSVADGIVSYFAVLWCFERIHAGEKSLRSHSRRLQDDETKITPALRCMYDSIWWHVNEWNRDHGVIHAELQRRLGKEIEDQDSVPKLHELAKILKSHKYDIEDRREPGASTAEQQENKIIRRVLHLVTRLRSIGQS